MHFMYVSKAAKLAACLSCQVRLVLSKLLFKAEQAGKALRTHRASLCCWLVSAAGQQQHSAIAASSATTANPTKHS